MPSSFSLRRDVHYCRADGISIFLQASRDRYFALSHDQAVLFEQLRSADTAHDQPDELSAFATALVADGILEESASGGSAIEPCMQTRPVASVFDMTVPSNAALPDLFRFLFALQQTRMIWFRSRRRMDRIATDISRWRRRLGTSEVSDEVLQSAAVFHHLTPFFQTVSDRCLFRSIALIRFLSLSGHRASLEIGVRTSPFAAHCWVEHGGVVLNDHTDHVLEYQKIWSI